MTKQLMLKILLDMDKTIVLMDRIIKKNKIDIFHASEKNKREEKKK